MGKRRQERMTVEIKRVLSTIIKDQIKDPRIDLGAVSITRVDVTNDISHARVYISVLGDAVKQEETIAKLKKVKGFIRSELARVLEIRHAPELELRLDKSIEHGIHISSLLEDIKEKDVHRDETDE
ncbi:MAG: 30S ribosome-binding factor RbfA [Bacillota bacterium]|nr:30S ribosome-binding factor RbfA [Bacillota bacterium]